MRILNLSQLNFKGKINLSSNSIKLSAPKGVDFEEFRLDAECEFGAYYFSSEIIPADVDNYGAKRVQIDSPELDSENIRGIYFNGIDYYIPQYDKVFFCEFKNMQDDKNSYASYGNLINAYKAAKGNNITIEA